MKVYQCYKKYPAKSADITIYVREYGFMVIVEFFKKESFEPFSRKLCENFAVGSDIAEEYIVKENFEKVKVI